MKLLLSLLLLVPLMAARLGVTTTSGPGHGIKGRSNGPGSNAGNPIDHL